MWQNANCLNWYRYSLRFFRLITNATMPAAPMQQRSTWVSMTLCRRRARELANAGCLQYTCNIHEPRQRSMPTEHEVEPPIRVVMLRTDTGTWSRRHTQP